MVAVTIFMPALGLTSQAALVPKPYVPPTSHLKQGERRGRWGREEGERRESAGEEVETGKRKKVLDREIVCKLSEGTVF